MTRSVRAAAGAVLGAAIGWAQVQLDRSGMRAASAAPGLDGIGVAAQWLALFAIVSLVLTLACCAVLRLRWWAATALAVLGGEVFVMQVLWERVALPVETRAYLWIPTAGLCVATAAALRHRDSERV